MGLFKKKSYCVICNDTGVLTTASGTKPCNYCEKGKELTYKCTKCKDKGYVIYGYWGDKEICNCQKKPYEAQLTAFEPKYSLDNSLEMLKLKPGDNEVVPAKPNELQLDYDVEELPEQFLKVMPILRERFGKGNIEWKKYHSSSGKHLHVIVTLPEDITDQGRIIWQAVFGSDCVREGISVLRMVAHIENPSLLFMPKHREVLESGVLLPKPGRRFKELA